jgi:rhodanese-related sulfurtransferase
VAQQLRKIGFNAVALEGGFNAWRDKFPVEPISAAA